MARLDRLGSRVSTILRARQKSARLQGGITLGTGTGARTGPIRPQSRGGSSGVGTDPDRALSELAQSGQ